MYSFLSVIIKIKTSPNISAVNQITTINLTYTQDDQYIDRVVKKIIINKTKQNKMGKKCTKLDQKQHNNNTDSKTLIIFH